MLATGAACFTPYGFQPILATFKVFVGNEALRYTQEWQPTILDATSFNGPMLLVLLFLALYRGVKIPLWRLLAFLFLLYLMLAHLRFASLFAIVAPILLAAPLTNQLPFSSPIEQIDTDPAFFEGMARLSKRWFYTACSLVGAGVIAFGLASLNMTPEPDITPKGAVD